MVGADDVWVAVSPMSEILTPSFPVSVIDDTICSIHVSGFGVGVWCLVFVEGCGLRAED